MAKFDDLLEQKFISRILVEEGRNIDSAQLKEMTKRGFNSRELLAQRHFSQPQPNNLQLDHLKRHRYIDMKTRETKKGVVKKISHPIHNRILFGHANNIVRRLSFEFTSQTKAMLMEDFPKEL